jgi:hypothetical protein
MTRSAIIKDGRVANIIIGETAQSIPCGANVQIGWMYANGSFTEPPVNLENRKEQAIKRVDDLAERARSQYITPGDGQAMVYLEKADEALAYQAATNPVDADYPFLLAESASLEIDISEFAALVIQNRNIWKPAAAEIEATRAAAKAAIRSAPDQSAIDTILNGLIWPQP